MWFNCMYVVMTIPFLVSEVSSQECPVNDEKTAVHFLLDHKSNSRTADHHCVDRAFATLSSATQFRHKNYVEFLVGMLDFERWTPEGYVEAGEPKYPAMDVLEYLNGGGKSIVPYLIKAIRESDSEVLRANAAETLYHSVSACEALRILERRAEKENVPNEQMLRIEAAAKHINDLTTLYPPCEAGSSKP